MITQEQLPRTADLLKGKRLDDLFLSQAQRTPNAVAISFEANSLTYAELARAANALASTLQGYGVKPGTIVGLYAERSLEMIVAMLGILKAGGAYLPLDPAYPKERLTFMLEETEAPIVLLTPGLHSKPPATTARHITVDLPALLCSQQKRVINSGTPEDVAYIIYTSGSTGKPKGVLIEHKSIANYALAAACDYGFGPSERLLQFSSICFDASVEEIFGALCSGATLVLRTNEMITSAEVFLQKCDELAITILDMPTAFWHELAGHIDEQGLRIPKSLRTVIIGGEQALVEQLKIWHKHAPRVQIINTYGPTEATVAATFYRIPRNWSGENIPIGRAVNGLSLHVFNADMRPVPINAEGELYIGGIGVARGYLKRPELTASKFISHPLQKGERLYRTGDLVRQLPDGNLQFLGRVDHQVKIRGFRVELGEIETVLNRHPGIRQALVVALELSPGDKQLVAYATLKSPAKPEELRHFAAETLPGYMVPARYVILDSFPMTPGGKIDRKALPKPSEVDVSGAGPQPQPRTLLEMKLQLIFARFFNRPDVGMQTSFFELGGDSLQALKMIVEIERATQRKLPLGILYRSSTVEQLAATLEQDAQQAEPSALIPLQIGIAGRPPLFLVHTTPGDVLGYGNLVYHLDSDQPIYGFQSRGLDRIDEAHTSIEAMAAYYIQLMRSVQPHGPYYLGGWCYGGIVSVEMAHQLRAAGEQIALLALIETPAPAPNLRHFRYYFDRISSVVSMSPREWNEYLRHKIRYYRNAKLDNKLRYQRTDENEAVIDPEIAKRNQLLEKLEKLYAINMDAVNKYKSKPYPGKIVLLNAEERDPAVVPDRYYGWRTLAREIELHTVPGNHDSVLMEPNVRTLTNKLGDYLGKSVAAVAGVAIAAEETARSWAVSFLQTTTTAFGAECIAVEALACSAMQAAVHVL